jgi:hypothetical protein
MKTMMLKVISVTFMILSFTVGVFAQVGINNDGSMPDSSAMLDVKSTNQGVLIPRLTEAQIEAIENPVDGLIVYCTTYKKIYIFNAETSKWKEVALGTTTIGSGWNCGNSIIINHIAGTVAPVNKTVTYGTVTNIPGETSKCWITSNLGADHKATAVDDATEASAGWYWQFNRKQGYKHDGTTRTPNTAWIVEIVENSDWQSANDPCNIELGTTWRIPTDTEWYNVYNTGGWNNLNSAWNSGLRLHAAGFLDLSDGSLSSRGFRGLYYSSTPDGSTYCISLNSDIISDVFLYLGPKTYGNSLRCIKE